MCLKSMKIISMSSVMVMNSIILNIHVVNSRWMQAIKHFVHKQINPILS